MTEITINTIDDKTVSFRGVLISVAEEEMSFDDSLHRKYSVSIYEVEHGGFVSAIRYDSGSLAERSGCILEQVDEAGDVEKCLFVFSPDELLPDSSRMTQTELDSRKRLSTQLHGVYERLANATLDQFDRHIRRAQGSADHSMSTDSPVLTDSPFSTDSETNPETAGS